MNAAIKTEPVIKPVTRKLIRSLRGSLKGKGVLKAMMEDRQAEREITGHPEFKPVEKEIKIGWLK